jgi:hypothetical protein
MLYKELRTFLFYFVWVYRLDVSSFRRKLQIQIICYVTVYTLHYCFFFLALQSSAGYGLLVHEVS